MTTAPAPHDRPLLPVHPVGSGNRHGSRSHLTCYFRCGNACDRPEPNRSDNGHIQDEIAKAVQRRSVLKGAAVGSGALVLGGMVGSQAPAAASVPPGTPATGERAAAGDLARTAFRPVAPNKRDAVTTAEGFDHDVVIRWGDPVVPGAPGFDVRHQTPEAARQQFGYNCDYVGVLPLARDKKRALLVVNHEYTDEDLMFPTGAYSAEDIARIAMANHGMSVVTIKRGLVPGSWLRERTAAKARRNRRIHTETAFTIVGPAAGDERLRTTADPTGKRVLGTLNNCAGGTTPWGTVLSGEENFNQYFDKSGELDPRYAAEYARYGITGTGSRGWSAVDPRFDLTTEPHEPHRFGWIVEIDPDDPTSTPRKLTMLGRFKHEGANIAIARNGRVVAYMGDDERGDYMYKYVSAGKLDRSGTAKARRHNMTLLSKGTLHVAAFAGDGTDDGVFDGTGRWIPLCSDTESFVDGMSVADVLIFTRLAADRVAATRMDRPEDVEPNPVNGKVYAALTNNSNRGKAGMEADEANPITSSMVRSALGEPLTSASGNRNGYVLELTPAATDHAATTFTWDLMLVCGDPAAAETYFGGYDKAGVSPISCPDNVAFDTTGNLWISTDGNALGSNDGIFRVPTKGPERGRVQQFVTMPRGAEACGPLIADQNRSLFFAVQHPGEVDGATFEDQASTWPHTDDFPRPSVCVAFRQA
ncbi:PhoX family phosphatase [Nocardioides sp.]|uniref:PhoX family protein n=1 Tax=Nocardioides sp. TaxID=35761 RepID=UPI0026372BAC|nr:PhoX family phosphatase [Nocardioides sp.]MDI6909753.1 PhoX family phosphatase [Nocardioides sp.]